MKLAEILKENLSETAERKISARFKLILNMANDGANYQNSISDYKRIITNMHTYLDEIQELINSGTHSK
jgi:CHASE3 domain sensor protein